jgi:hypothetical protein
VPALERTMTYRLRVRGPLSPTAGSPLGERRYFEMTEGTLDGPGIAARVAMPGGDWMRVGADGFWRPDVRVSLLTDDGAVILLHYTGLVQQTPAFQAAAAAERATEFSDQYMRMAFVFDTGAEKYAWLNQSLFVAEGRLAGPSELEYGVYRVT